MTMLGTKQQNIDKALSLEALIASIPEELPPTIPLTSDASSWMLHIPKFFRRPDRSVFQEIFRSHPSQQHALKLYGKTVYENRFSQMFVSDASVGSTYKYSGTARSCIVCDPNKMGEDFVLSLCEVCDIILSRLIRDHEVLPMPPSFQTRDDQRTYASDTSSPASNKLSSFYNCCLMNWYKPEHHIGLHADDERELNNQVPIVSLSWGGPRRFLLRPKPTTAHAKQKVTEILLKDGDLLIMGGKCQDEFKHEIPKVRKMDGLVGDRISWTIRSMNTHNKKDNHVSKRQFIRERSRDSTERGKKRKLTSDQEVAD